MECYQILLVDDDDSIRETLAFALEASGYRVHSASNGLEGIEALTKNPDISLILLDLMMPVLDGWGFMSTVREDKSLLNVPIIVLTAAVDKTRSIVGVERVIKKPIDIDFLFETVSQLCGARGVS